MNITIFGHDIDLKNGKLTYDALLRADFDGPKDDIDDDLLLIEYPNDLAIDVSYHCSLNILSVNVVSEYDWEDLVYTKNVELNDKAGLLASIREAIDIAVTGS